MPPLGEEIGKPHPAARFGVWALVLAAAATGFWAYFIRTPPVTTTQTTVEASAPLRTDTFAAKPSPTPDAANAAGAARAEQPARRKPNATAPAVTPSVAPPTASADVESQDPPAATSPAAEVATPEIEPPAVVPEGPIYDGTTADVTPPALLTPIAIAPVRRDQNYVPGLAAVEIIVSGNGRVESVRAARQPGTVGETLEMTNWLSITKSWRFGPAVRNGQPVRYRLIVPLSALVSGRGLR
jgi:hypothetical protein